MLRKFILNAMILMVFSIGTNTNVFGQAIFNETKTMKKEVSENLVSQTKLKNLTALDNTNQSNYVEKDNLKNHNKKKKGMSTKTKVAIGLGIVAAIAVIVIAVSLDNFEENLL